MLVSMYFGIDSTSTQNGLVQNSILKNMRHDWRSIYTESILAKMRKTQHSQFEKSMFVEHDKSSKVLFRRFDVWWFWWIIKTRLSQFALFDEAWILVLTSRASQNINIKTFWISGEMKNRLSQEIETVEIAKCQHHDVKDFWKLANSILGEFRNIANQHIS